MQQYLNVLKHILDKGTLKPSAREGMPETIGLSFSRIEHDLQNGFPLLTTKKVYFKGIVHELIWFLRGDTNIKYLIDNNVNIWNQDAYRFYLKKLDELKTCFDNYEGDGKDIDFENSILEKISFDKFINLISGKNTVISDTDYNQLYCLNLHLNYSLGDLGKVYGYQLRNQNEQTDQVSDVISNLINTPFSRYSILNMWNKKDMQEQALPACHCFYQFIVRPDSENSGEMYLDLNMYQRSCDMFLGVPFNIASMSLMLLIFAKVAKMKPGVINWLGGDCHIYTNQIDSVKQQLKNEPLQLPTVEILKELNTIEDIENLQYSDFVLKNYNSHGEIKGTLSTGLKL